VIDDLAPTSGTLRSEAHGLARALLIIELQHGEGFLELLAAATDPENYLDERVGTGCPRWLVG